MITEGHEGRMKYLGKYRAKKVIKLKEPVICFLIPPMTLILDSVKKRR